MQHIFLIASIFVANRAGDPLEHGFDFTSMRTFWIASIFVPNKAEDPLEHDFEFAVLKHTLIARIYTANRAEGYPFEQFLLHEHGHS